MTLSGEYSSFPNILTVHSFPNILTGVIYCVQAEEQLHGKKLNHEYAGITGLPEYNVEAAKLAFGDDSPVLKEKRVICSLSFWYDT